MLLKNNLSRYFSKLRYYSSKSRYKHTLNIRKTDFPSYIKKGIRSEHDEIIRKKYLTDLYKWQSENLKRGPFVLHDGPPYANGDVHMGHALNKVLKDIVLKTNIINGIKVCYKPGWDCHGLPIELKAKGIHLDMNPIEIRQKAREFALETAARQREEFESWGVTAEWNSDVDTYRTIDTNYIKNQLNLFYKLYQKGLIFRDLKPVYWSPSSKTALAEAELEYDSKHVSPSLIFRMKLKRVSSRLAQYSSDNIYALVWTTTPWNLPANQAICYNSEIKYCLVRLNDSNDCFIVAEPLIPELLGSLNLEGIEMLETFEGSELSCCTYFDPITKQEELPFLDASHVSAGKGTGLVHTAPAHSFDDYKICIKNNIKMKCLIDEKGQYNDSAPTFLRSKDLTEGNQLVLNYLKDDVIYLGEIVHKRPIDWRTKKPVVICATLQWFINIEAIKAPAVTEINRVRFYPDKERNSLVKKISERPYWCISRQRAWGTPIPVFYSKESGDVICDEKTIQHICLLLDKHKNIDFWWSKKTSDLLSEEALGKYGSNTDDIQKGMDILDIWFDSGISWSHVLDSPKVADLYLEGQDQITGWFQASLITSVGLRGIAPYKTVYSHGFTVDEKGIKMSKSLGNVIWPKDIISEYCVDAFRWSIASHAIHSNIRIKPHLLAQSAEKIGKFRLVLKFLLTFVTNTTVDIADIKFDFNKLTALDKYILNSLVKVLEEVDKCNLKYEFTRATNVIDSYIVRNISGLYIHTIKDRLYCDSLESTEELHKVLLAIYLVLSKMLWPIAPLLVEENWSYFNKSQPFYKTPVDASSSWCNNEFDSIIRLIQKIKVALKHKGKETWRLNTKIFVSSNTAKALQKIHGAAGVRYNNSELCELLQVQSAELVLTEAADDFSVETSDIDGELCIRCRRYEVANKEDICSRCKNVISSM